MSENDAAPIAEPASANAITVTDRRGNRSDIHSAVIDPMKEPLAEIPSTATYPVVCILKDLSIITAMLAIQMPNKNL